MTFRTKLIAAGMATMAALATTVAASAAPAVATGNVNVRTGPSTGYPVVDTLRRGEHVDVQYCRGSWCYVEKRGPDGWVSANYLRNARPGWNNDWDDHWDRPRPPRPPQWDPYPPRPPHWNPRPLPRPIYPDHPHASMCFNGPNGYFCIGT
ncbi:SH3 domain-containing protein [uncultured Devosia sp.]|uniref:SH3 domain-containing protein n=1 Tax=uncultured Devosia sp. TaxID=211434 RepID=UPI00261A1903|nr:SH3 domain-containing protein [uncultured Devosia sp.]